MTSPPVILHVAEACSTGILQVIRSICSGLEGEYRFVLLHGRRAETPKDLDAALPASVELKPWPSAGRVIHPSRDRQAYRELIQVINEVRPDLIHAHASKAGALARIAGWRHGRPVLYSPHAYGFLQRDAGMLKCSFFYAAEWGLGRLPATTIACGEDELVYAARVSRKARLIANQTLMQALPSATHPAGPPYTIAMSGRLSPQKQPQLFAAIARLVQEEPQLRFLWIGGGEWPGIMPANVEVTGWLEHEAAFARLGQAHLFLQTAAWEGRSIAMLEALSVHLPILAYDAPGNRELVLNGSNGFLFRTPAEAAAHLKRFIHRPARLTEMSHHSKLLAKSLTQPELWKAKWRGVYLLEK